MSLIKTIQADYLAARYAKDTLKANLLSTLLGEAQTIGKDAGNRDATDEEAISVIKKFIKNANYVAETARNNVAAEANAYKEIEILNSYLPQQMDSNRLDFIVREFLSENPDANLGRVMGYFKANYAGQYDGQTLSQIVKAVLA